MSTRHHAGPLFTGTQAERLALDTTGLASGAQWIETDTGAIVWWNGSIWTSSGFVPLTTPLTSTDWDGDSYSITAKTLIDLSAVFGVPAGIRAIDAHIIINDSGSPAANLFLILSPNETADQGLGPRCDAAPTDAKVNASVTVPCNVDGDVYYQAAASDAGTMDVWIAIWGYWL